LASYLYITYLLYKNSVKNLKLKLKDILAYSVYVPLYILFFTPLGIAKYIKEKIKESQKTYKIS